MKHWRLEEALSAQALSNCLISCELSATYRGIHSIPGAMRTQCELVAGHCETETQFEHVAVRPGRCRCIQQKGD